MTRAKNEGFLGFLSSYRPVTSPTDIKDIDQRIDSNPVLRRFVDRSPLPVMARAILETFLSPAQLNAWFERVSDKQYTRKLLFSFIFDLMTRVVLGQEPSVHAAFRSAGGSSLGVSLTAVYKKLNGLEMAVCAGLVGYAGQQGEILIRALGSAHPPLVPGTRVRVLDGNSLKGREHRLQETRDSTAAPLPGKCLVVFDPALELITHLYPCEDAYTQERALLDGVLADTRPEDLWVADRNFCTGDFLRGLADQEAYFVVREHDRLRFTPLEPMRFIGRCETGEVWEQRAHLGEAIAVNDLPIRRIQIKLDKPTRNGDDTIYLIAHVPANVADAPALANLYHRRWTIERAFLHLTTELRCEVDTLTYPPAALFAFSCAAVAFNVLSVTKATLRAAHGTAAAEQVSGYYLAIACRNQAESLDALIDPEEWDVFHSAPLPIFAGWLRSQAERVDLSRFRKTTRGPKKPPPKRTHDRHRLHVSVARLLAKRQE